MRVSVFLGVDFSQPMMLAHFERRAYTAVLFSKYTKLWPLSLQVHQTYAILVSLLPSIRRLSSPSPVLGEESLPRMKASCLCFWQNHGLHVRQSICFIPFVRQYLPETGRDYAGKITRWRVTQTWNPGFESCSASCCLCAVIHMWVINKCHVPGTMPGVWVSKKNKAWYYCSRRFTQPVSCSTNKESRFKNYIVSLFYHCLLAPIFPPSSFSFSLSHTYMLFQKKSKAIITRKKGFYGSLEKRYLTQL